MKRTGILGGTFNPVHTGHLVLAQDALERFGLDRVIFVPCASPPHKKVASMADARDRVAMLRLAVKADKRFEVSTIEVLRGGVSYSIDTLRELQLLSPGDRFHFIIGSDMLKELHTWKDIRDLLPLCEFVTMSRPGAALRGAKIRLPPRWVAGLKRNVFEGHEIDISSTEIRERVANGRSIRYLVPDVVARYISDRNLYKEIRPSNR